MKTRDKLQLMRESDRRNEEHERAFRREGENTTPITVITIHGDRMRIRTTSRTEAAKLDALCIEDPEHWERLYVTVSSKGAFEAGYSAPADLLEYLHGE